MAHLIITNQENSEMDEKLLSSAYMSTIIEGLNSF